MGRNILHYFRLGSLGNWLWGGDLHAMLSRWNPMGDCRSRTGPKEMLKRDVITARPLFLPAGMALRSPDVKEPALHAPLPALSSTYTYWPVIGMWAIPREWAWLRAGHYLANISQTGTPVSRLWAYSNWGNKNLIPGWGIWTAYHGTQHTLHFFIFKHLQQWHFSSMSHVVDDYVCVCCFVGYYKRVAYLHKRGMCWQEIDLLL